MSAEGPHTKLLNQAAKEILDEKANYDWEKDLQSRVVALREVCGDLSAFRARITEVVRAARESLKLTELDCIDFGVI